MTLEHEQEIQYYRQIAVQGCAGILSNMWWRDHRLEFPHLSDLAGNTFCVMETSAANERRVGVGGHVVNSRRSNLKSSSVNDILFFNNACKAKNEALKVDQKVSHFYFTLFLKTFYRF